MILTFSNGKESISLYGDGGGAFNIISVEGMSFTEKRYTTVRYYGVDGQTTVNSSDMPRTITISGDMLFDGSLAEKAVKVLSKECTLLCISGNKRRKTRCKTLSFELGKKMGKYRKFTLQVECDSPYFTDEEITVLPFFKRVNLVTGAFQLPCMFTERISNEKVENYGDEEIYPIVVTEAALPSGVEGEKYIKICNETTGAVIFLECDLMPGERLTVDLEKREIKGSVQGNLLNRLKEGYLSDFYLAPGENIIKFENHTSMLGEAYVTYYNKYRECVF